MSKETKKHDEPLNGLEAIQQFASKGAGFSKPNAEAKVDAKEPDPVENEVTLGSKEAPLKYDERLRKLKISDEEAMEIIDQICEKGSYLEPVVIRKARDGKPEIKAVFTTRDTRTQGYIALKAAQEHKNVPMIYEKIMGEFQLAGSLVYYNGKEFDDLRAIDGQDKFEDTILQRVLWLSKLPAPITVVLQRKLGEFDLKVAAVMAPGYEDFF